MTDGQFQVNQVVNQMMIAEDQIGEYVTIAKTLRTAMDPGDVVAEANQVYPRIWDALAGARQGLDNLGCDVRRFDALRAAQGGGASSGGLIDADEAKWDVAESLMRLGLVRTQQVSYSLNLEGVAIAAEALDALKTVAPAQVNESLTQQRVQAEALGLNRKPRRVSQRMLYGLFVGGFLLLMLLALFVGR